MAISRGEKIFYLVNNIFLILLALLCLVPVVHMLAVSLSDNSAVVAGLVSFWPRKFSTATYEWLFGLKPFWNSMGISVLRVVTSTVLTLIFTVLAAYPLSKNSDRFLGRTFFSWSFFLTMILTGGMIPTYMTVSTLGLIGNFWALVIPTTVVAFYVLIILNFFRGLPEEMEEAARIDGASEWGILFRIVLPVATPALATIAVFSSLAQWNEWFLGIIYMRTPDQYPLMSYLQTTVVNINLEQLSPEQRERLAQVGSETYRAAQLFIAAVPMMCVYPFLQRYFVQGLVLGSVKG
jgi:putative aldouronate transport system permease protein